MSTPVSGRARAAHERAGTAQQQAGQDVSPKRKELIAVIGMAGRFPDAPDIATLWQNLLDKVVSIQTAESGSGPTAQASLADADLFDAALFRIGADEAAVMDPQHRLFLECCWAAVENAGYDPTSCPGPVGIFAGCAFPTYLINNVILNPDLLRRHGRIGIALADDRDALTSRVSQKLDLRGPSVTVATFSSTSLVAVHIACQSLLSRECDVALAGAAAVKFPQVQAYRRMSSPNGECRSFDAKASGSVIGNAVAVIVLKRLADALRQGDHVDAVILGSAVNSDGRRARIPGLAGDGKAAVIVTALADGGIPADSIAYVEGQGIATLAGDSAELAALTTAFRTRSPRRGPCLLGSITANLGHAEGASGVAGLIKAALMVRTGQVPGQPSFTEPNVVLAASPLFAIPTRTCSWPSGGGPRRAGVNSFGLGGTNAHIILEEPPPSVREPSTETWPPGPQLIVASARTAAALDQLTARLGACLASDPKNLGDVAFTLQTGRAHMRLRRTLVCSGIGDAAAALCDPRPPRVLTGEVGHRARSVVLIMTGEPWDCLTQARELYAQYAVFRNVVNHCADALGPPAEGPPRGGRPQLPASMAAYLGAGQSALMHYALGCLLLALAGEPTEVFGVGPDLIVAESLRNGRAPADLVARLAAPRSAVLAARDPEAELGRATARLADPACLGIIIGPAASLPGTSWPAEQPRLRGLCRGSQLGMPTPRADAAAEFAELAGWMWRAGLSVRWRALHEGRRRLRVVLPAYPFERHRHWVEPSHRLVPIDTGTPGGASPTADHRR